MMFLFWFEKFKALLKNFAVPRTKLYFNAWDYFELGNSFFLYYLLIFGGLPLALALRLPSRYVEYFIGQSISIFNTEIFIYLFIGVLFFILGYKFLNFQKPAKRISQIFIKEWTFKRTLWVFGIVFLFNFIVKAVRIFGGGYFHLVKSQTFTSSSFYSLIGLLDWLGPAALAIAFAYYFHLLKNNDFRYRFWRVMAWGAFVFEFSYGFFSGSKFYAVIPIAIYLIVKHYAYEKSFKRVVIAGLLIIFVLMPFLNFYNNPSVFLSSSYSVNGRVEFKNLERFTIDSSLGRFNQSKNIFNIFKKTGEFLYGRSLLNFFISLGPPRFIWKDKPVINASGNEFGRAYGIISPDDFGTNVGPTIIGDLYLNFGAWGIVLGMLFFGALLRFIFDVFIRFSGASLSGIMIYSVFWIHIIKGMEDWIAPVWAGLVKLLVILLVIHWLLSQNSAKTDAKLREK